MMPVFSNKSVRLLLAISVSIWMAGGCLLGCSNSAMAASWETDSSTPVIVAGKSCHSAQHQPPGVPSFAPTPLGTMKDCPLVTNATAITSKNSGHLPDPGRVPVAALPLIENKTEQLNTSLVVSFVPNRGPTHLRCCVFLI
jgi:hypothetical protein